MVYYLSTATMFLTDFDIVKLLFGINLMEAFEGFKGLALRENFQEIQGLPLT